MARETSSSPLVRNTFNVKTKEEEEEEESEDLLLSFFLVKAEDKH